MKIINHSILGGGLSALIRDQVLKNGIIFCETGKKVNKSGRFYEYMGNGGNSNLWGGYINIKRLNFLFKNKKFKKFIERNKLFEVKKLYKNINNDTFYLSEKKNKNIFRVNKKKFNSRIINIKIERISISEKYILLFSKKKIYKTKHLNLCLGNLGLIELLFKSKMISENDKITIRDGKCTYTLNFFLNKKENYYIPMTFREIIIKLIFKKIIKYKKKIGFTLFSQKFTKKSNLYSYKVKDIMFNRSNNLRFFLSNHPVQLKINKMPIDKFLQKKSLRLKVFNSGICKKYYPGPISQDIIYNASKI
jgi:hypothetical protein